MSSERVTRNCYPSRLAPPPLSEFSGLQGKDIVFAATFMGSSHISTSIVLQEWALMI